MAAASHKYKSAGYCAKRYAQHRKKEISEEPQKSLICDCDAQASKKVPTFHRRDLPNKALASEV